MNELSEALKVRGSFNKMEKDLAQALRQIYESKQEIKNKYQGKKTVFISDMKSSSKVFSKHRVYYFSGLNLATHTMNQME